MFSPINSCFAADWTTITPEPYFYISVLAPNTSPARNQYATLFVELLPKIGIGVEVFDHTSWSQISPRTWRYPGPYPIPSYAEGGYDVLLLGWRWDLDLDFTGLYDSASITPAGDNFYQYSNSEMDWAITNYTSHISAEDREPYAKKIQELLYSDIPSIPVVYPLELYPVVEGLEGWNPTLWIKTCEPMNNWSLSGSTDFHYAIPSYNINDFHPFAYHSDIEDLAIHQIYNGLFERNTENNNDFAPWLAESYSTTDGLTYNIIIKDDACWADGTNLTTDDVIYNYQILVTPSLGSTTYSRDILYWDNDSITKINDKEFNITFKQYSPFQLENLAISLIPKHIWESIPLEDHREMATNWSRDDPEKLFGAGPYILNSTMESEMIHLQKNSHFVDWTHSEQGFADIYLDYYSSKDAALEALTTGAVDMIDESFSVKIDELNSSGITYELVSDGGVREIAINMEQPYLGTGEFCPIAGPESANHIRKAINYLLPREMICEEIFSGQALPAATLWSPTSIGFDQDLIPFEYSLEKAVQEMALAGFDTSWTQSTNIPGRTALTIGLSFAVIGLVLAILMGGIIFSRKK